MNIKKYLIEQTQSQKMAILEKAIESGCIAKYKDFEMDKTEQPVRVKVGDSNISEWAVTGKSKKSGDKIIFLTEFMGKKQVIINLTEAEKEESQQDPSKIMKYWTCEQSLPNVKPTQTLTDEQNTYLNRLASMGWTRKKPTEMDLDNKVYLAYDLVSGNQHKNETIDAKDKRFDDVKPYKNYFGGLKEPLFVYKINSESKGYEEVERGDCRDIINKLYDLFDKKEGSDELLKELVRKGQKCLNQKDFALNPFLKKKIDVLTSLDLNNPRYIKYRLYKSQNESISKKIKQTLVETKQKKQNILIERKIVESRIKLVLESMDQFKRLSKDKKIKVGFRFLQEVSYFKRIGFLNEELGSTMRQIFGKSLDGVVSQVSEPFLNSIVNKLGLSNELQVQIIDVLKMKNQELLDHMDSCAELSKFLTDSMVDTITDSMQDGKIFGSEIIDKAVLDSMKEDTFKIKLSSEVEGLVCDAFNKFTENAKNLVTKLTSV